MFSQIVIPPKKIGTFLGEWRWWSPVSITPDSRVTAKLPRQDCNFPFFRAAFFQGTDECRPLIIRCFPLRDKEVLQYNITINLSRHEQVCLIRLRFERCSIVFQSLLHTGSPMNCYPENFKKRCIQKVALVKL